MKKYEIRTSESEILEEENRKPTTAIARGRAHLSECAVYGKRTLRSIRIVGLTQRKLWFTGALNRNLYSLVDLYGVNEATSEKAMGLMKAKLAEVDEVIRKRKEAEKPSFLWVQGVALPLGEAPCFDGEAVKTHKGYS